VKPRTLALGAALSIGLLVSSVAPTHVAGAAAPPKKGGTARLVSVISFTRRERPASKSRDALRAPARKRISAASCSTPGAGTGAYALSGTRVNGPTTAYVTAAGTPATIGNAVGTFQAAFNAWKAAASTAPTINVVSGGTAKQPTANHRYELMFANLGGRTLAVTYTWRWSTGEYESDTVFSKAVPWFQAPGEGTGCVAGSTAFDLQNTATHEFGHTYGLAHVSNAPFNTMYPSATLGETYKRSPESGDAAGIHALYG
jgi:hypothetical protein